MAAGHPQHLILPVLEGALVTSPQSSFCVSHLGRQWGGVSPWGTLILLSRGRGRAEPRRVPVSAHSVLPREGLKPWGHTPGDQALWAVHAHWPSGAMKGTGRPSPKE